MLLTVIIYYPPSQADKVGKKFIEVTAKYPDDPSVMEPLVHGAVDATLDGIRVIGIASIKEGKAREALDLESKRMLEYAKSIEGFRYSIDISYDVLEAMDVIGMESPV
jgi:hypothetical protein